MNCVCKSEKRSHGRKPVYFKKRWRVKIAKVRFTKLRQGGSLVPGSKRSTSGKGFLIRIGFTTIL